MVLFERAVIIGLSDTSMEKKKHRMPIMLIRYMIDSKILISLIASKVFISYRALTKAWLPHPDESYYNRLKYSVK